MNSPFYRGMCSLSLILLSSSISLVFAQAPKTAKIVFTSTRDGNSEIYTMNVDGSRPKNLTQNTARDEAPVWAPTGNQIAFHSDRHGLRDIYIMAADGKNVRKLLKDLVYREFPTWSPDGKMLAYYRWDGSEGAIYIADIETRQEKRLTLAGPVVGFPDWSPDGSEIVFTFKEAPGSRVLRVVNVTTREERTLFDPGEPASLFNSAWSPDGNRIAFSWLQKEGVYVLDRGSNRAKKLTAGARPAWAPRGDDLLYNERGQIFIFNLGRRTSKQLTAGAGTFNFDPDWFDPATLPVQPNPELLTTQWGRLKQK